MSFAFFHGRADRRKTRKWRKWCKASKSSIFSSPLVLKANTHKIDKHDFFCSNPSTKIYIPKSTSTISICSNPSTKIYIPNTGSHKTHRQTLSTIISITHTSPARTYWLGAHASGEPSAAHCCSVDTTRKNSNESCVSCNQRRQRVFHQVV